MDFDFQRWATLAREDGAEFERQRRAAIDSLIAQAPLSQQQRLRGLQFRLDLERSRSSTALGACVRMNRLMWESFSHLREQLNSLSKGTPVTAVSTGPARVVPFVRPPNRDDEPSGAR